MGKPFSRLCGEGRQREGKASQVRGTHCVELPWACGLLQNYVGNAFQRKKERRRKNIGSKILALFYLKSKSLL